MKDYRKELELNFFYLVLLFPFIFLFSFQLPPKRTEEKGLKHIGYWEYKARRAS